MDCFENSTQYKNTKTLLSLLTSHLQSREDCKGCTYYLNIEFDSNTNFYNIAFKVFANYSIINPYVFPSKHQRSQFDKAPILHHIFSCHHIGIAEGVYGTTGIKISDVPFIEGAYQFKPIGKRRQWVKIR